MPSNEATLKRLLDRATGEMADWIKVLDQAGVAAADRRKNPKWRQLNAAANAIRVRLKAVADVSARNADAQKRKAEKLAGGPVEKDTKKAGKGAKGGGKEKAPAKKEKAEKAEKPEKKPEKGAEPKEKKKKE